MKKLVIKRIIKDIKENLIPFVLIFTLFLSAMFIESKFYKKRNYTLISNMIFTQPDGRSSTIIFSDYFNQDLHHYLQKPEIKNRIDKICFLKDSIQSSKMKINKDGFNNYASFTILHKDLINQNCMNKVFNDIIYNFYEEYLSKLIQDYQYMLKELQRESLSNDIRLHLSSFRNSYRDPVLIEINNNITKSSRRTNLGQIITIAFIFSVFLSLLFNILLKKTKRYFK